MTTFQNLKKMILKPNIKIQIMKNNQKPAASKLVARFDNELRNLIMEDLRAIRGVKNHFLKAIRTEQLSVA